MDPSQQPNPNNDQQPAPQPALESTPPASSEPTPQPQSSMPQPQLPQDPQPESPAPVEAKAAPAADQPTANQEPAAAAPASAPAGEDPAATLGVVAIVLAVLFPLIGLILGFVARNKSREAGFSGSKGKIAIIIGAVLIILNLLAFVVLMVLSQQSLGA